MPAGICVFLNSVFVPLILSLILLLSLILIRVRKILCFYLLLGVFLGEWKGTGGKTRGLLVTGLLILAASIVVTAVAKM